MINIKIPDTIIYNNLRNVCLYDNDKEDYLMIINVISIINSISEFKKTHTYKETRTQARYWLANCRKIKINDDKTTSIPKKYNYNKKEAIIIYKENKITIFKNQEIYNKYLNKSNNNVNNQKVLNKKRTKI